MTIKVSEWEKFTKDFVISDVIKWTETIWPTRKPRRKSKPRPLGKQKVTGQITGIEGDFVTLTILRSAITENPDRADIKPHAVGADITKKIQTILKGEPERLLWSEEDVRKALLVYP